MANTPVRAGAANAPSPPRANRMPEKLRVASSIFPTMSVSAFDIASNTPLIRENITFTAESISSGSRFAIPSSIPMIISNTRSTIFGILLLNDSKIEMTVSRIVSTNVGTISFSILRMAKSTVLIVLTISGTQSIMS